jgi:hypothetical protein
MALLTPLTLKWNIVRKIGRKAHSYLPELNFITLHYLYFITTSLVSAGILWGSATPSHSLRFTDALFLSISAQTEAGLNTVNLSTLNTFQQFVLFFLIIIGSAIFVSAFVVHVRRRAFEHSFRTQLEQERRRTGDEDDSNGGLQQVSHNPVRDCANEADSDQSTSYGIPQLTQEQILRGDIGLPFSGSRSLSALSPDHDKLPDALLTSPPAEVNDIIASGPSFSLDQTLDSRQQDHITFASETRFHTSSRDGGSPLRRALTFSGVGARSPSRTRSLLTMHSGSLHHFPYAWQQDKNYELTSAASISRNSNFHHLTKTDRLRLGGREYRAVAFLGWIVPIYFVLWQLLGCLGLGAYINRYYANTTRENGLNPW